jgi:hypothetical protein
MLLSENGKEVRPTVHRLWRRHTMTIRTQGYIYLLISWSRVLLEKLTSFQLVKKFPAFYGT